MKRGLYLFIALIIILILITGCKQVDDGGTQPPSSLQKEMPDLVLLDYDEVVKLSYDKKLKEYKKVGSNKINSSIYVSTLNDNIFVATKQTLTKLNNNLEKQKELNFKNIDSLATSDNNVFISADGKFIALDKNMNVLSSVELLVKYYNLDSFTKNAHDILIYKDVAYLLDNVISPLYIFQVDIKDPKNIKIIKEIQFENINPHLKDQWLDPELDLWLIIKSTAHMGGGGQSVLIYSIKDGKKIDEKNIYSYSRHDDKSTGMPILAITEMSPAWTLMRYNNKLLLAKTTIENNEVISSKVTDVNIDVEKHNVDYNIKQVNEKLFITAGKSLRVVDIKQDPKIILSQELEDEVYQIDLS